MWWSLGNALTNPALGLSTSARFAEWVRDHGGQSLVVWGENLWYSHHTPKVGGAPAVEAIPTFMPAPTTTSGSQNGRNSPTNVTGGPPARSVVVHLAVPAPVQPFASPVLAGEGQWHPAGRTVGGRSAVYETFLRPDAVHTSVVVGVAWMDTRLLRTTLYSGSYIPGDGPFTHTAPILPADANTLVAAFNAGFRMQDANGGYFTDGRTVRPLRPGAASFVIKANGSAEIGSWGSEVAMTRQVVAVRQNLDLIVDHGAPVPGLKANDTHQWGDTIGSKIYVWRSGVGITADGALVYVGGPDLNITDLAAVLARAGAVRAMELDINTDWVNFAAYAAGNTDRPGIGGQRHRPPAEYGRSPGSLFRTVVGKGLFHDVGSAHHFVVTDRAHSYRRLRWQRVSWGSGARARMAAGGER